MSDDIHPSQAKLQEDLEKLGLKPAEREVLIDIFGWNNRDRSTPQSYHGLAKPSGSVGLLLRAAVRAVAGEMTMEEIRNLLDTPELLTVIIMMAGWHKKPEFSGLDDQIRALTGYLAPELLAVRAREAIGRMLLRRMGEV